MLLIWWDSLLVLDLSFNILDGVRWLNLKGDGLACEGFDEDLHTTTETQHQVECGFLLDVVVAQSAAILELLSSEDETLLIWWDSLFVLNLCLDILDGVRWLNLECDGLACEGLDKDLHTTTETQHQVECGFFLDVVIAQSATILELLSSKDETLLIWWDTLLVLDFSFDILDGVRWLNLKGDGLACEGFHEDLHTTTETQHQVECRFLLDVVIAQ